jgi:hypothetical protein
MAIHGDGEPRRVTASQGSGGKVRAGARVRSDARGAEGSSEGTRAEVIAGAHAQRAMQDCARGA